MIRFEQATVRYEEGRTAISGVSFEVGAGEFVFLIGQTGAGKSTLLKLLYREQVATEGRVLVHGADLARLKARDIPRFRREMGVVFQDYGLLPNRTVFENVAFALRVIGASRSEVRHRTTEALSSVGLLPRFDAYPHQLSGGEQQRVAIARAIVNHPKLLIADEPTGNLDPETSDGILDVLLEINQAGTTVLVATHDQHIVDRAKQRVIVVEGGQIGRDDHGSGYHPE